MKVDRTKWHTYKSPTLVLTLHQEQSGFQSESHQTILKSYSLSTQLYGP